MLPICMKGSHVHGENIKPCMALVKRNASVGAAYTPELVGFVIISGVEKMWLATRSAANVTGFPRAVLRRKSKKG